MITCKKSEISSFASSIMKKIVVFPGRSRFPLFHFFALLHLDQHLVFFVYLNSLLSYSNF